MNTTQRMQQMAYLCMLNGWSRQKFEQELRQRYPNGPSSDGPGWDEYQEQLDNLYKEIQET